jgi:hypothetical protein
MRRRSPTRRALKWLGTLLCVPATAVYLASLVCLPWGLYWTSPDAQRDVAVTKAAFYYQVIRGTGVVHLHKPRGWWTYRDTTCPAVWWLPRTTTCSFSFGPAAGPPTTIRRLVIPLWIPVVALAIPTTFLWWRDRRPPKDHCQRCAYDLTGNVSGVCPECGTPLKREGNAP